MIVSLLTGTGRLFLSIVGQVKIFFYHVSAMSKLVASTLLRIPLFIKNPEFTTHQMFVIGVGSLPLVLVTSIFIGGETVIQANFQFSGLVPMRYLGFAVSKSLVTELCPVLTSFVVASRVATGIAAEIGFMKINEQLDAMLCLSLDSLRYFIMPRVIAAAIMVPILVIISEVVAFAGSAITAFFFVKITTHVYLSGLRLFFSPMDMLIGIAKTSVFGAAIAFCGSFFGMQAMQGAKGIGDATTRAVMVSMVVILFFDFVIAFTFL